MKFWTADLEMISTKCNCWVVRQTQFGRTREAALESLKRAIEGDFKFIKDKAPSGVKFNRKDFFQKVLSGKLSDHALIITLNHEV